MKVKVGRTHANEQLSPADKATGRTCVLTVQEGKDVGLNEKSAWFEICRNPSHAMRIVQWEDSLLMVQYLCLQLSFC